MKLKLIEKPTIIQRGEESLFIFPSRPYWFAASNEVIDIVSLLNEEIDAEVALRRLAQTWSESAEVVQNDFEEVVNLLREGGVLIVDGFEFVPDHSIVEPTHQVSEVERVLIIAATRACNLKCPHCYANAQQPLADELDVKGIKAIVDQVAEMPWDRGVTNIALTGGEIFVRPDALELIRYIGEKGFHPFVNTNATLLSEEAIAELASIPRLKLSISLDGPDAKSHEFIRGPGTFVPTIEAAQSLINQGVSVAANMFVHGGNLALVGKTLELARSIGMQGFNCLPLMRVGRANSPKSQALLKRVSEVDLYRTLFSLLRDSSEYREMMKRSTFVNQVMGIAGGVKSHYCGIGTNRALYVTANGNLYPCPDTALKDFLLGNLKHDRLSEIWESHPKLSELRRLNVDTMNSTCSTCDVRYLCGGNCRGETYQVTGDFLGPHYNCRQIRASILEIMWMLTEDPTFCQGEVASLYAQAQ